MSQYIAPQKSPSSSPALSSRDLLPLAPLSFLQGQRRGSITDPSLHAAANPGSALKHSLSAQYLRPRPDFASVSSSDTFTKAGNDRSGSPFTFGDAIPSHSSHLRRLLRSPSFDTDHSRPSTNGSQASDEASHVRDHSMHVDPDPELPPFRHRQNSFDYSMRRHSIDPLSHPFSPGRKRKMSCDRGSGFDTVGEEAHPLAGPGVPSLMEVDAEAPARKRRGSAFDTQRIAQLSLNERRNSVDSRGTGWWNERRDSTSSSIISGTSTTYSSTLSGTDSSHGRVPPSMASFSWPSSSSTSLHSINMQHEIDPLASNSKTETRNTLPPMTLFSERRMSVPDIPSSGGSRALRSRSRPPSRQRREQGSSHSAHSSGQEDQASPPLYSKMKEGGSAPYSRSPELRVSHKLAERKRRKEMKDLFDELRDHLPADRGMKASKWEILSKAIDFVSQLKEGHQEMAREIDMLRHELAVVRRQSNITPFSGQGTSSGGHRSTYPANSSQYPSPPQSGHHNSDTHQSYHPGATPPGSSAPKSLDAHRARESSPD